jgi:cobalt/nickel transport system permease protein
MLSGLAISIPLAHGLTGGWWLMVSVMTKGLLCFTAMLLLAHTTPFEQILAAMGRLGVPRLFVATLAAMFRFLFVFQEERTRMQRARLSRTFAGGNWLRNLRAKAGLVGMLLVRSSERAERVHAAMLARGFNDRAPSLDRDT